MKITTTPLEGLCIIESVVIQDERGYFFEAYNRQRFADYGLPTSFAQDNESQSHKGVLRGLHYQKPPFAQGKLVRVIAGAVLDIAVDLRKNSATYGQHYSCLLSAENKLMFYIPEGFAHGFYTLADHTIFTYKCTQPYNKEAEGGLIYNDPTLNINWNNTDGCAKQVSERDINLPLFKDFVTPF